MYCDVWWHFLYQTRDCQKITQILWRNLGTTLENVASYNRRKVFLTSDAKVPDFLPPSQTGVKNIRIRTLTDPCLSPEQLTISTGTTPTIATWTTGRTPMAIRLNRFASPDLFLNLWCFYSSHRSPVNDKSGSDFSTIVWKGSGPNFTYD